MGDRGLDRTGSGQGQVAGVLVRAVTDTSSSKGLDVLD
jgi:hypothetical protein